MKIFFVVALSLAVVYPVFAKDVDSRVSRVVVYSDTALVSRTATTDLSAGEHEIVFPDIIPDIDENSLKVSGVGSAAVKILGAQVKKEFLTEASSARVKELEKEIEALRDESRKIADHKNVAVHKKQLLDSLLVFSKEELPGEMATKMPQAKELTELLNFLDGSFKDYYAVLQGLDVKAREVNKKLNALQQELGQVSRSRKMKRSIAVDVAVAKGGSLTLEVTYLVRGASWYPVYEARTMFDRAQVALIGFGVVKQKTGEDWKDVEVTLSTAKPAVFGRLPEFSSWILRPFEPRPVARRKSGVFDRMMVSREARYKDMVDAEGLQMAAGYAPEEALLEAGVDYADVQEKGVSVVYQIPRKVTIKADGSEARLPVLSADLPATFQYTAYPRSSIFAYLTARVTNKPDLQLLAGRMNIFLEGDFVGISALEGVAPQEPFELYLGVDENVKVKKEEIARKVDDVLLGGIPSPTRKVAMTYKITAENYKNKDIVFDLFDSIPVSEDERIRVRIERVAPEPAQKDYKDHKGVWRWQLNLSPRAKKEIVYTVIVEHPRGLQVEGL